MYTIYKRLRFLSVPWLTYICGNSAVGKKHKLLNEFVCVFRNLKINACGRSVWSNIKLDLRSVEIHRSLFVTTASQLLGKRIKFQNRFHAITHACLNHTLCFFIREASIRTNNSTCYFRIMDTGFIVHFKYDGKCEFIFIRAKRADPVAEVLR